ncbi:MAG: putative methyltransferase [Spartobacteria bacterium]|nr:putative methyltransferase [Spartobacteria bacterium]
MSFLSVVGYGVIVLGMLGLWRNGSLFATHPFLIAIQVAAVGLMIWARITFGWRSFHLSANPTAGGLVTNGPYRFIRHPIYTAICVFVVAGLAGHLSAASAMLAALIFFGANIRIYCEERLLEAQYPDYRAYSARTRRMLPGIY